jgi:phage terminase large subunit GpA-like protein
MRLQQVGHGYVHVPKALSETDEFEQMTAARLLPAVVQGKHVMRWITPAGKREEGGDCQVYAYAGACYLGIQQYREPSWARREAKIAPRALDLFSQPQPAEEAESPANETAQVQPQPPTRQSVPRRGRFGMRGDPWRSL